MGLSDFIAIAGLCIAVAGGIALWAVRVNRGESAATRVERVERDLADFKERVARDYATAAMVAAVESRVVAAIDRLGDRLDRVLERRQEP